MAQANLPGHADRMWTSNGYVLDESPSRLGELRPVPDAERTDRKRLRARLHRDGYLFLPGALDPAESIAFRRYYFATLAPTGLVRPGTDPTAGLAGDDDIARDKLRGLLFGEIVPGETYARFCNQPAIQGWYAWFLGGEPTLHRRKIIRHTRPGENGPGTATAAHYDLLYLRDGTDQVLSSWIPLGDCPTDLGGLVYLEGSHHRTRAEEQAGTAKRPAASITADLPSLAEAYDTRWLLADYAAGDMVVHSAYLVHAALDNMDNAGRMRLSTDIRYQRADQPIDRRWQQDWYQGDGL
jgi:hypothetical protein